MKKTWLIVVCSVLALCMIVFLVNFFTPVREKARGAVCLPNHRQLAIAIQMYTQAQEPPPSLPTSLGFATDKFPGIDGSTSTQPLTELLCAEMLNLQTKIKHGDVELSDRRVNRETNCYYSLTGNFHHNGTHEAYVNLLSRPTNTASTTTNFTPCELILVARKPSAVELRLATTRGVELDVRPVALDAFVFLVNKRNRVRSLTLDQIRAIYIGKTTNWKALGGRNQSITAYTRNANSGSEELMRELVMGKQKMIERKQHMLESMSGPIEAIAMNPDGIAYSVYYYEHFINHAKENRLLAINGIAPTKKTIAGRTYPLTAEVYVVTRKKLDPKSPAAKVRDWLLSAEGQRMVAKSGYVPIKAIK